MKFGIPFMNPRYRQTPRTDARYCAWTAETFDDDHYCTGAGTVTGPIGSLSCPESRRLRVAAKYVGVSSRCVARGSGFGEGRRESHVRIQTRRMKSYGSRTCWLESLSNLARHRPSAICRRWTLEVHADRPQLAAFGPLVPASPPPPA